VQPSRRHAQPTSCGSSKVWKSTRRLRLNFVATESQKPTEWSPSAIGTSVGLVWSDPNAFSPGAAPDSRSTT
jgi:hypothetical protein